MLLMSRLEFDGVYGKITASDIEHLPTDCVINLAIKTISLLVGLLKLQLV